MSHRRIAAVITFTFVVGAAGLMLWAQTTSPSPIRACVAKDGTTRLLLTGSACKSQEILVQWNAVGPEGPEGPQGPPGADGADGEDGVNGATGPRGPSDAYVLNAGVGTTIQLCDQALCSGSNTLVASLSVPAGAYTITAKLVFNRWNSLGVAQSYCYLIAGNTIIDTTAAATSLEIEFVPASLQGAGVFTTDEILQIQCADSNGLTAAQNWQLVATKVESVNAQ